MFHVCCNTSLPHVDGAEPRTATLLDCSSSIVKHLRNGAICRNESGVRRGNNGYPAAVLELGEVQRAASKLGLDVDTLEIRRVEDIVPAFGMLQSGVQALYVCPDALVNAHRGRINTMALGARLPTMHGLRESRRSALVL